MINRWSATPKTIEPEPVISTFTCAFDGKTCESYCALFRPCPRAPSRALVQTYGYQKAKEITEAEARGDVERLRTPYTSTVLDSIE